MTEEEQQKLDELHRFFMRPPFPGKPSRAEQIDEALEALHSGRIFARAILWIAGLVVSIGAAFAAFKTGMGLK